MLQRLFSHCLLALSFQYISNEILCIIFRWTVNIVISSAFIPILTIWWQMAAVSYVWTFVDDTCIYGNVGVHLPAMASWMPTYGPNYSHTAIHNETVRNNPNWFSSNPACLHVESWNRRLLRVPLLSKISKILNEEGISGMWAFNGMIMISVKFCSIQALYIMFRVFVFRYVLPEK